MLKLRDNRNIGDFRHWKEHDPTRGWLRIRPRITHKPGNGVVRARLVISPTIPLLARPAILL